jgi:hypothetical protein
VVTSSLRAPVGGRRSRRRGPLPYGRRSFPRCRPSRRNRPVANRNGIALPVVIVDPPPSSSPATLLRHAARRQIPIDGHHPTAHRGFLPCRAFGLQPRMRQIHCHRLASETFRVSAQIHGSTRRSRAANDAHFQTEIAQRAAQFRLHAQLLALKQLAAGQQCAVPGQPASSHTPA